MSVRKGDNACDSRGSRGSRSRHTWAARGGVHQPWQRRIQVVTQQRKA
jgi:hypothetical protein